MVETILDAVFGTLTREQRMLVMRIGWIGVVTFHMAWVCGWLAFTGMASPFAKADVEAKVSEVVAEIRADRAERLDQAIQTVRALQCRTEIESPARANYTDRLNELWNKYLALTGLQPRVPACDQT